MDIRNYIYRKLCTIRRYPDDMYDIKYFVIDISQSTAVPRLWHHRAIPYSMLASEIIEIAKKNHAVNIEIYQGTEYISDLCVLMYMG